MSWLILASGQVEFGEEEICLTVAVENEPLWLLNVGYLAWAQTQGFLTQKVSQPLLMLSGNHIDARLITVEAKCAARASPLALHTPNPQNENYPDTEFNNCEFCYSGYSTYLIFRLSKTWFGDCKAPQTCVKMWKIEASTKVYPAFNTPNATQTAELFLKNMLACVKLNSCQGRIGTNWQLQENYLTFWKIQSTVKNISEEYFKSPGACLIKSKLIQWIMTLTFYKKHFYLIFYEFFYEDCTGTMGFSFILILSLLFQQISFSIISCTSLLFTVPVHLPCPLYQLTLLVTWLFQLTISCHFFMLVVPISNACTKHSFNHYLASLFIVYLTISSLLNSNISSS
ncbi:hypothetical protein VP01_1726g2 [Puccinia sorghi]|uniref:Uncharacterized protein n=1 Tax=Puccinia sorghi TaxID=27349 RepID=A0A0L6VH86_9BASI|nr:hypothetical protein VP01_1726g2 [Puccinia sorghi]